MIKEQLAAASASAVKARPFFAIVEEGHADPCSLLRHLGSVDPVADGLVERIPAAIWGCSSLHDVAGVDQQRTRERWLRRSIPDVRSYPQAFAVVIAQQCEPRRICVACSGAHRCRAVRLLRPSRMVEQCPQPDKLVSISPCATPCGSGVVARVKTVADSHDMKKVMRQQLHFAVVILD